MAKQYFVRSAYGQKGPYTLKQMKAALAERAFSADAEFRTGDDGPWQPIATLAERLARSEKEKRAEAEKRAPEIAEPEVVAPPPGILDRPLGGVARALILLVLAAIAGVAYHYKQAARVAMMGKPCRSVADCQNEGSCMLTVDADRNIRGDGYCTFECSSTTECAPGMYCGKAVETGPQGAKWDGTFGKSAKVCLKR